MENDKSLSEQQEKQFTDFSHVADTPGAPMKFDGKEVRGVNVNVVSAPQASKKNLIVPIVIVALLVIAMIVIVLFMFKGSDGSGEGQTTGSSVASSQAVTTSSGASAAGGDKAAASEITVKFKKPDAWGDSVNVYVYSGGTELSKWPGEKMKKEADGTYSFTIPSTIEKPLVIFNDDKSQYPLRDKVGLDAVDGKTYSVES